MGDAGVTGANVLLLVAAAVAGCDAPDIFDASWATLCASSLEVIKISSEANPVVWS